MDYKFIDVSEIIGPVLTNWIYHNNENKFYFNNNNAPLIINAILQVAPELNMLEAINLYGNYRDPLRTYKVIHDNIKYTLFCPDHEWLEKHPEILNQLEITTDIVEIVTHIIFHGFERGESCYYKFNSEETASKFYNQYKDSYIRAGISIYESQGLGEPSFSTVSESIPQEGYLKYTHVYKLQLKYCDYLKIKYQCIKVTEVGN